MPRLKQVRSLTDHSLESLAADLVKICKLDPHSARLAGLASTLEWLPGVLTDLLVERLINSLIDKRNRTLKPLFAAFKFLPLGSISKLDFRRAFMGYRLSRDLNIAFKSFIEQTVVSTERLTELVLKAKCTDAILKCLSEHCQQLVHLNVALSDGITDEGLLVLRPGGAERPGCPNLTIIDLNSCIISASSIASLVLSLPRLRRVYFTNMASVITQLNKLAKEPSQTFLLDYFEFYSSENENFDLKSVPETFPAVNTLKLLIKDEHMNHLTNFSDSLCQIDVELSSDTGEGCLHFFQSRSASNLTHINLQVTSLPGECILAIAVNCPNLNTLKFQTTSLENEGRLVPSNKYFQNLQSLICRVYSEEWDSSDEDEDVANDRGNQIGLRPQTLEFFVQYSYKLVELQVEAHCSSYLTDSYLAHLLQLNPLTHCEKLVLNSPGSLDLGKSTIDLVMTSLSSLSVLQVSRWKQVNDECIEMYRQDIKDNNLDLELI